MIVSLSVSSIIILSCWSRIILLQHSRNSGFSFKNFYQAFQYWYTQFTILRYWLIFHFPWPSSRISIVFLFNALFEGVHDITLLVSYWNRVQSKRFWFPKVLYTWSKSLQTERSLMTLLMMLSWYCYLCWWY